MSTYIPQVGDVVKFNAAALRQRSFHGARADGRRRMKVVRLLGFGDCLLDDGDTWNACWLEVAS